MQRHLVFAGRNLQALARLHYDIHPLLETDPRLRIHYAITPGSQFRSNTKRFSHDLPHEILPWEEAQALQADLAISASANGDFYTLAPQVMLLPHGAGHSRKVGTIPGASGLSSQQLRGPNGELPAALALPGAAAQNRLAIDCPEAIDRAHLLGDICLERLRLSENCRAEYRRHLGIGDRTLVMFSSTWGPHSAYAQYPDLPRQLHNSLPADEYAVAFVPHPNIEAEYRGPLPNLHQPYFSNGLFMPRIDEGWRALLVASDVVLGDHGSVTAYAAALDKPIGLPAFGFDEVTPDEPLRDIGEIAPRFDPETDLAQQVDTLISSHQPGQYRQWTEQILAEPSGNDASLAPSQALRRLVYELIDLPLPAVTWSPQLLDNPTPAHGYSPTTAWICDIDVSGDEVTWQRYPISHSRCGTPTSAHAHTITDLSTRRPEWREATVLLRHHETLSQWEAGAELNRIFSTHQLCAAASVRLSPHQVLIGTPEYTSARTGRAPRPEHRLVATAVENPLADTALAMSASAIYWWQRTRDWNTFPSELIFRHRDSRCRVAFTRPGFSADQSGPSATRSAGR